MQPDIIRRRKKKGAICRVVPARPLPQPIVLVITMSFASTIPFDSPTGARLGLRIQPATTEARAVLMISHGLAEHSARYRPLAERAAGRGFHVLAHDHRGHGETIAPDAPIGRFAAQNGGDRVLDDLGAIRNHVRTIWPELPVMLFGHSMGGMIAANAAGRFPDDFHAVAIWNSHLNPGVTGLIGRALLHAERFFKGSDVPSAIAPKLTFEAWGKAIAGHRTPFDWLSHDASQVDAYIADPLCGFDASVSMWIDVITLALQGGSDANLARYRKTMPVHLGGGTEDPATDKAAAMRWLQTRMKAHGLADVTLAIFEGQRHETLNEIEGERFAGQLLDWLESRL